VSSINKILTIIDKELEKRGIIKGEVAKRLNVSGATITNLFKRTYNKIGYMKFIELTKIAFGKYHHEYIKRFCLEYKGKLELEALEWAYANGNRQVLNILIANGKQKSDYPLIIDVYELQSKRMENKMTADEFLKEYQQLKFSSYSKGETKKKSEIKTVDFETTILLEILYMYTLTDSAAYPAIEPISKGLLNQIEHIKSSYLRTAYTTRVQLFLIFASIKSNNLHTADKESRKLLTEEVYDNFPMHYNHALIYLTEIHVFDDFKKSSQYIKDAVKMIEEGFLDENDRQQRNIRSTFDFVYIHHNKLNEKLFLEDPAERAHFLAKGDSDKKQKALEILNDLEAQRGKLSNFQLYYKALAKGDINLMDSVKERFYLSCDFHYVKLPKKYIEDAVKRVVGNF
jgi:hypothetical protein